MEDMLNAWKGYKNSMEELITKRLEYQYKKNEEAKKILIIEALIFWKFIFEKMDWDWNNEREKNWAIRRDFLRAFINNDNQLIKIIAMIESMPTAVWRKILWKHNIDFMSFESFLRRLDNKQATAIMLNYQDLIDNKVPRVYSRWEKIKIKYLRLDIFTDVFDHDSRYCNKGAMSYNLLNLDFGFNAYPEGTGNDEKVVEVSPLRFLSIKNHADDFVVNTEAGGKYWWLYRKARSNYAWRAHRNVKLQTRICPGFWYTFIAHLIFWIVSPVTFSCLAGTIALNSFSATSWLLICTLGIPGIITPLWILKALIKFIFTMSATEKTINFIDEITNSKPFDIAMYTFTIGVMMVVVGFISAGYFFLLSPGFGIVWSILIILATYAYLGYKGYSKCEHGSAVKMAKYPLYLRIPIIVIAVSIIVKFLYLYLGEILSIMISFLMVIWNIFAILGLISVLLILPLAIAGATLYIFTLDLKKQEKFYRYMEKALIFFVVGTCIVGAGMIFYAKLQQQEIILLYLCFFVLLVFVFCAELFAMRITNPKVRVLKEEVKYANDHYCNEDAEISGRMLAENKWFQSLDKEEKIKVLKRVVLVIKDIFVTKMQLKVYTILLPKLTEKLLDSLERRKYDIRQLPKLLDFKVVEQMSMGRTYEEALSMVKKEAEKEKAFLMNAKKILRTILSPLIFIGRALSKLVEYAKTFYRIYELFNERCPYVVQRKVLKF